MQEGLKFNVNDLITYTNIASGTVFKAKVVKRLKRQVFILEIVDCNKPHFIGQVKEIDFGAPQNHSRIEILEIEPFEKDLAKYEAAKHFNNCLLAVDTDDKEWFDDSFKQYILWKSKIEGEEGLNNG